MERAGLYIHIPFCQRKCGYCDFYSITNLTHQEAFVEALLREADLLAPRFAHWQFDTVFVGGGTPTVLAPPLLERIVNHLRRRFHILPRGEYSIEANPGTVEYPQLRALRQLGFNRLSLGAQSFFDEDLRFLERIHTAAEVYRGFEDARRAGFDNINLDLITAFPGLTPQRFGSTLKEAVRLQPEHISCYTLILEPGTPFYRRMERGELTPVEEETEAMFYRMANQVLGAAGYEPYEISNFARDRQWQCRHNLKYWHHQPYLGLGPSAHSFDGERRWWNVRSLAKYIRRLSENQLPMAGQEVLSDTTRKFEYIFLHLRLREGIPRADYLRRFGRDPVQEYQTTVERLRTNHFLDVTEERIKLTNEGWLLADEIASYFQTHEETGA